jgi:hypothetical protein
VEGKSASKNLASDGPSPVVSTLKHDSTATQVGGGAARRLHFRPGISPRSFLSIAPHSASHMTDLTDVVDDRSIVPLPFPVAGMPQLEQKGLSGSGVAASSVPS